VVTNSAMPMMASQISRLIGLGLMEPLTEGVDPG